MKNLTDILGNKYPKLFNKKNEFLLALDFDITMACNNRCPYCSRLDSLDNAKIFNSDVFEETIKQITKFSNDNPHYRIDVEILGGDPLMVSDKTVEFIKRLQLPNVKITVYSNFNFKPNSIPIKNLFEAMSLYKFSLKCSWHEVSNELWVKENIKLFQDRITVIFLLNETNILKIYELTNWVKANVNSPYEIEEITVCNAPTFVDYDNLMYNEMFDSSHFIEEYTEIDNNKFTTKESKKYNFKNISKQFFTVCKLSQFVIKFDGSIYSSCTYNLQGHINNGFPIKEVLCSNNTCSCDIQLYKKLIKEIKK